ncbi:MAG: methyltransferase domain-containing protein, partial [Actinomycetota bacterium]|nr:methyltransferase domain-containing protein [Actinomycetota bacterium]
PGLRLWAVDIAKPAVRLAARRGEGGSAYAVASVYDLPVLDASIDVVVSVFAPLASEEFERVLRPGGLVVTVTPGRDHLDGLKARLFPDPEQHPDTGPFERPGATTRLRLEDTHRVTYLLDLAEPRTIADLLGMTPYAWYVAPQVRSEVASSGHLTTTVDFRISAYRLP